MVKTLTRHTKCMPVTAIKCFPCLLLRFVWPRFSDGVDGESLVRIDANLATGGQGRRVTSACAANRHVLGCLTDWLDSLDTRNVPDLTDLRGCAKLTIGDQAWQIRGFVELREYERFDLFESKMDNPGKIKSRSPAHEARRLAGYEDDAEWRRFLVRFPYHRMLLSS